MPRSAAREHVGAEDMNRGPEDWRDSRPEPDAEDHVGGRSGGRTQLTTARLSVRQPVWASVWPVQRLCVRYRDLLVVHGKEKVYGSIP